MDLQELVSHSRVIVAVVEGSGWTLDETIAQVVATGDWDFCSRLLVSASEVSARGLAKALLEADAYAPLAVAACFRRQPRRPGEGGSGGGRGLSGRVFRDIDSEDDAKGVPDYIRADIEEMASTAAQTRIGAMTREALMDRDPIRQYIIDNIGPKMATSGTAMDAMVAIARASAWEETRRTAALKVANDPICVSRLVRALRTEDVVAVAEMALLGAVAETFAKEMGKVFKAYSDAKDVRALRFMAENHPDAAYKDSARQWAEALEKQVGSGG